MQRPAIRPFGRATGVVWTALWALAALGWALHGSLAGGRPDGRSWWLLVLFALAAVTHAEITRPAEERRRGARPEDEHVDHGDMWVLGGAVALPMPLALLLVLAVRLCRHVFVRARGGPRLVVTCSVAVAAVAANTVAMATGTHGWVRGEPMPILDLPMAIFGALFVTGAYYAARTAITGVARVLDGGWSRAALLGDRGHHSDLTTGLAFGLVAAWLAGTYHGLPLLALAVAATGFTRRTQRVAELNRERARLELDALHDPLTGLANQRAFNPAAALALVADQARRRPTAVMMFDLDRFKQVNSRLGHLGANEVLKACATLLRNTVRHDDLVCRWGGEEFSLVLPGAARADAWAVAERVRRAVESMTVELPPVRGGRTERVGGFTISGGIALSPEHGTDLTTLQEHADQALSEAKNSGRNRVRLSPPIPRPGPVPSAERHLESP